MKKTYGAFIAWLIAFTIIMLALPFLFTKPATFVRLLCIETVLALLLLTYMVYRTETVYWYTGVSFEAAVQAGQSRRKAYALAYLKRFALSGAVYLLYAAVAVFLGLPWWLDLVVCFVAEVGAAVSTLHIKL